MVGEIYEIYLSQGLKLHQKNGFCFQRGKLPKTKFHLYVKIELREFRGEI